MKEPRAINKIINLSNRRINMRQRIKRLIHKPIDHSTTALATVAIFGMVYIACIPYLLGKRTAPPSHDPIDF